MFYTRLKLLLLGNEFYSVEEFLTKILFLLICLSCSLEQNSFNQRITNIYI